MAHLMATGFMLSVIHNNLIASFYSVYFIVKEKPLEKQTYHYEAKYINSF